VKPGSELLALAVARQAFRLYAYKDEYEVARLYGEPAFAAALEASFEGERTWRLHFTLPWQRRAAQGAPRKRSFGPWMRSILRLLAHGKRLRGTPLDPFGRSPERKLERALIIRYEQVIDRLLSRLDADRLDAAVEIAALPEHIRGFGVVKRQHAQAAHEREARLLAAYETDQPGARPA
jgi:indolepyruvate ferredoxin oxidoreductase